MIMFETLDVLPGEGEEKIIRKMCYRRECEECGAPAHYKHTFLYLNGRNNPASSAYGHDDCSWCEDACKFVCKKHLHEKHSPEGMSWCATFPASKEYAHMFLAWQEMKEGV
jgi:hypothetical protein